MERAPGNRERALLGHVELPSDVDRGQWGVVDGSPAFYSQVVRVGVASGSSSLLPAVGDETPAAGTFTVEVENQSSKEGAFALGEITSPSTIDDLEAYVEKERQRIQQGAEILVLPTGSGVGTAFFP